MPHMTAVPSLVPSPSVPVFTQEHVATDDKVGHVCQTLAVLGKSFDPEKPSE